MKASEKACCRARLYVPGWLTAWLAGEEKVLGSLVDQVISWSIYLREKFVEHFWPDRDFPQYSFILNRKHSDGNTRPLVPALPY